MAKVLLFEDLPVGATQVELRELLSGVGSVVSMEESTAYLAGAPRGRSFVVELASDEAVERALALNGNGISVSLIFDGPLKNLGAG